MGAKLDLHLDKRWYLFTHEILMDIDCGQETSLFPTFLI